MNINLICINVVMCLLSVVAIYTSVTAANGADAVKERLRLTRVEAQQVQQSIHVLESVELEDSIKNLDTALNELKINVAEFISDESTTIGVHELSYELVNTGKSLLAQSSFPIQTYQLDIKFTAGNAKGVVNYLKKLKAVASPWPTEVRACDIHRLVVAKLSVHCVVNIHHWSDV